MALGTFFGLPPAALLGLVEWPVVTVAEMPCDVVCAFWAASLFQPTNPEAAPEVLDDADASAADDENADDDVIRDGVAVVVEELDWEDADANGIRSLKHASFLLRQKFFVCQ